ncbi:hypothetical protein [Humidisolicoccus flavus]|uniref:hypothetical protein n=1 Tax=Humidisolicoccus flavus TaxID=3111414 RepID=UPI0032521F45
MSKTGSDPRSIFVRGWAVWSLLIGILSALTAHFISLQGFYISVAVFGAINEDAAQGGSMYVLAFLLSLGFGALFAFARFAKLRLGIYFTYIVANAILSALGIEILWVIALHVACSIAGAAIGGYTSSFVQRAVSNSRQR